MRRLLGCILGVQRRELSEVLKYVAQAHEINLQ